ncbi:MAG: TetR/AcrR family transcriptional regulator [Ignavibacteriae bacterium]|nr:TetR/AcrR family transcriptional regulator [Ignavibacteriota bacterium]
MLNERQNILKFSCAKFYKNGFYKTSMDEIASEMQISKKTIYKYFTSKESLLEETINYSLAESQKKMLAILDNGTDVINKLVLLLENYSSEVSEISDKWVRDLQIHAPNMWQKIDDFRTKHVYSIAKKLIRQGRREKIMESVPPEVIVESFVASLRAIVNPDFILRNNISMQQAVHYYHEIQLKGILTDIGREKYKQGKKKFKNKF